MNCPLRSYEYMMCIYICVIYMLYATVFLGVFQEPRLH